MGKLPCTSFAICTHIIHGRLIMQAETKGYHILTNNCLLKRSDLAECGLPFCVPVPNGAHKTLHLLTWS